MMTRKTRWLVIFAAVAIVYLMLAYVLLPSARAQIEEKVLL